MLIKRLINKCSIGVGIGAFLTTVSLSVSAHFLVMYTPTMLLNRASDVPFNMVFTHPFGGGPSMHMDKPEEFYYVYLRGEDKVETKDLMKFLEPVDWKNGEETVGAWKADIPRKEMRSLGDYQVVLVPTPYLEEEEDIYIQQFSKVMLNVGGVPGNWADTVGLVTEVKALNKPYANWTGGLFRGIVLSEGKPVPFTEVEVEYLNHPLDIENNQLQEEGLIDAPHPALEGMVVITNSLGEFAFNLTKAGWWGFAALDVGPVKEHKGKPLSQDAVLWVQATDIPK